MTTSTSNNNRATSTKRTQHHREVEKYPVRFEENYKRRMREV